VKRKSRRVGSAAACTILHSYWQRVDVRAGVCTIVSLGSWSRWCREFFSGLGGWFMIRVLIVEIDIVQSCWISRL